MEEDVKEKKVQIKITITTREALKHFGIKGESYETIIRRLMEQEEKKKGKRNDD